MNEYGNKFKPGWYVQVKRDLVLNETYNGLPFIEQMEEYKGKIYKVKSNFFSTFNKRYFLENIIYEFSEEMLELPDIEKFEEFRNRTVNLLNEQLKAIKEYKKSKKRKR